MGWVSIITLHISDEETKMGSDVTGLNDTAELEHRFVLLQTRLFLVHKTTDHLEGNPGRGLVFL